MFGLGTMNSEKLPASDNRTCTQNHSGSEHNYMGPRYHNSKLRAENTESPSHGICFCVAISFCMNASLHFGICVPFEETTV